MNEIFVIEIKNKEVLPIRIYKQSDKKYELYRTKSELEKCAILTDAANCRIVCLPCKNMHSLDDVYVMSKTTRCCLSKKKSIWWEFDCSLCRETHVLTQSVINKLPENIRL